MSKEQNQIYQFLMQRKAASKGTQKSLLHRREEADAMLLRTCPPPEGTIVEDTRIGGIPALWVRAPGVQSSGKIILYFHGGGFFSGSGRTHSGLAAALSRAADCSVLLPNYRLAPEHPYPAAHEDCLAITIALLRAGVEPDDIALGGDSSGGMLALATLLSLRDFGAALPYAAFFLSPWLDFADFSGESFRAKADVDPMSDPDESIRDAEAYFGAIERRRELALLGQDMAGLPPLLLQCGENEILLSDSTRLAEQAKAAAVDATLQVWPGLWHIFQTLTAMLPEAREAVDKIGEFLKEHA